MLDFLKLAFASLSNIKRTDLEAAKDERYGYIPLMENKPIFKLFCMARDTKDWPEIKAFLENFRKQKQTELSEFELEFKDAAAKFKHARSKLEANEISHEEFEVFRSVEGNLHNLTRSLAQIINIIDQVLDPTIESNSLF